MTVDPKITFWLGLGTTVALILAHAGIWTGAIPDGAIPRVSAWCNLIGTVGTAIMTALTGVSSSESGPVTKYLAGPKK